MSVVKHGRQGAVGPRARRRSRNPHIPPHLAALRAERKLLKALARERTS